MADQTAQADVLTLHQDLLGRQAAFASTQRSGAFLRDISHADRMLARLPGLEGALAGYSAQALALATAVLESPGLWGRLGLTVRSMQVADLAELVQIVLEDEVQPVDGMESDASGVAKASVARAPSQRSAKSSPLHRRLAALVREVRAGAGRPAGEVETQDPGSVGPADLTRTNLAEPIAASSTFTRALAGLADRRLGRAAASTRPESAASWGTTVHRGAGWAVASQGSRALRLAEGAADTTLLALAEDPPTAQTVALDTQASAQPAPPTSGTVPGRAAASPSPSAGAGPAAGVRAADAPTVPRVPARPAAAPRSGVAALAAAVRSAARVSHRLEGIATTGHPTESRAYRGAPEGAPAAGGMDTATWAGGALSRSAPAFGSVRARSHVTEAGGDLSDRVASPGASPAHSPSLPQVPPGGAALPGWLSERTPVPFGNLGSGLRGAGVQAWAEFLADRHGGAVSGLVSAAATMSPPARAYPDFDVERDLLVPAAGGPAEPADATTALPSGGLRASTRILSDRSNVRPAAGGTPTVPVESARTGGPADRGGSPRVWAQATAAALATVVAESRRLGRTSVQPAGHRAASPAPLPPGSTTPSGSGDAWFGHAAQASQPRFWTAALPEVLKIRPFGQPDALTGWLGSPRGTVAGTPTAPAGFAAAETERTWIALQVDDDRVALADAAARADVGLATGSAREPGARQSPVAVRSRAAIQAPGSSAIPVAVRAALAQLGEALPQAPVAPAQAAFLARFRGQPLALAIAEAERTWLQPAPGSVVPGAGVDTRRESAVAQAQAGAGSQSGATVLRGMAALEALLAGPGALVAPPPTPQRRAMDLPGVEQTLLQSPAEPDRTQAVSPDGVPGLRATAARAPSDTRPTPRVHQFSPSGLRHGRGLLARAKAAEASPTRALQALPSNARPSGAGAWSRPRGATTAGYGAAELGAGELLGLVAGDAVSFFGEGSGTPGALRGADVLASWVSSRRGVAPIRGHAAAVAGFERGAAGALGAATGTSGQELVQTGGGMDAEGPASIPGNFQFGAASASSTYQHSPQATLVEAGAVAARQASAAARATGGSASTRAVQAGAMARVLSVTDTPTGNMLPLVAPAAHAVVTAAAAKPQSEHIVTSGYDPGQGTPTRGTGGEADSGREAGHEAHEGHEAQDVDALAAKIARSVMLRMQRERERRGQYG